MKHDDPKQVVLSFWKVMGSNDFVAASNCLSEDYELIWPQSSERVVGRANFAAFNSNYPAGGTWTFHINALVAEGNVVVSDVSVSEGTIKARAITFSTVTDGLITKQVEYWPDDYPAPEWRAEWVERF